MATTQKSRLATDQELLDQTGITVGDLMEHPEEPAAEHDCPKISFVG